MRWIAASVVTVSVNAMLPATIRWGARGSSSQATMLTTLSARSPLEDARKSSPRPSASKANRFLVDVSTAFETAATIVSRESGILTQRLHRAIGAVGQEPERRDQDQREGQRPDEESERDPSGQQPTRAPSIAIVRVEQDVNPVAPLTLLSDPDLGLPSGLDGVLTRIARPVAQLPVGGILVEVVSHGTTIVVPRGCSLATSVDPRGAGTVTFSEVMEKVTRGFETVGVAILVIGITVAFIRAVLDLRREDAVTGRMPVSVRTWADRSSSASKC